MTQYLQVLFLNALGGLVPWGSQCSLVMKDIEKAIFLLQCMGRIRTLKGSAFLAL